MKSNQLYIREGITHIEELPVDKFVQRMRTLHEYFMSEKIDGSNIQFGIDSKGFYTSREDKGGTRVYDHADYPLNFATTFQRSAHLALESVLPKLRETGFGIGDRVEAEVLFGKLPNAVPYSTDVNRIIFLRQVDGDICIDRLQRGLVSEHVTVELPAPYTPDGKVISVAKEQHSWKFSKTPTFKINESLTNLVAQNMGEFVGFLNGYSGIGNFTNRDVLSIPLNKRHSDVEPSEWKEIKERVKRERSRGIAEQHMAEIKTLLLNSLVRNRSSKFGPKIEEGGWIEGVVFRHPTTNEQFKLVDKETFTAINKFNYDARYALTEKARSVESNTSFFGGILVNLASSLGHPELGTYQAKRYLRKFGNTQQQIIEGLSQDSNFLVYRDYWVNFLESKYYQLEEGLQEYQDGKHLRELIVEFAEGERKFTYNDEIDKRTLQTFATTFKRINTLLEEATRSESMEDLIRLLVGSQLKSLG